MKNRKNQTAVMTMATVLSVTAIASPLSIMAQEDNPAPPTIVQENGQQKTAPNISLPENLQAIESTTLKDVPLPDNWTWADESTIITAESSVYPARFHVDATSFDYSNIEGYSAEGNYVERMVTVTVEPAKKETTEPVQGKSRTLRGNMPTTYSAGDIAINANNFPDEAFRNWLELQTYGQDKIITQAEIAAITSIRISSNTNIKDLTGIGHFTALTDLNCSDTGITSLDVSKNTALTTLWCYNNASLENLTVAGATSLTELDCSATGITSLDVSKNTVLTTLKCYNNASLENLIVAGATSLTNLNCSDTGITSLDVSKNTALTTLWCYNNASLENLTVAGATSLTELDCSDTGITSLDVSKNTALIQLICGSTPLAYLNIGTNYNLTKVINSLLKPVSLKITEDSFNMTDKLTDIDVSKITNVKGADYNSNTGMMSNYRAETPITYTYNCGTSAGGTKQTIDVTLQLEGYINPLVINEANFPDPIFRQYVSDTFDTSNPKDGMLSASEISNITTVNVIGVENLGNIKGIEYFTALQKLYCRETEINELDISQNIALTDLDCSKTNISELDVKMNPNLTNIFCYDTKIKALDVSQNSNLYQLICYNTEINELKLENNSALAILQCYKTNLKVLDVSKNIELLTLICNDLDIKALDLATNTKLTYINCANTNIEKLDLSTNKDLSTLQCRNTKITRLDVSECKELVTLDCAATKISTIDVSKNEKLQNFDCTNNSNLTSVNVSGAANLGYFFCSNTAITSLDVSNNKKLVYLSASNKSLAMLNLGNNTNLATVQKTDSYIDVNITGNTFNIKDMFKNIDTKKITFADSNVSYDKDTGIVTILKANRPTAYTYTYDCGRSKKGSEVLQVTLNLKIQKKASSITVNQDLHKTYDGKPIENPTVDKTGSTGTITFTYEVKKGDTWEICNDMPTKAGVYRVVARLAEDDFYNSAETKKEFTISQADSTISITENLDKDYDGTAISDTPSVNKTGSSGTVSFKWEQKKNETEWELIASAPKDAGTYRVTATLAPDNNYKGKTSVPLEFTISQAINSLTEELSIKGWTFDEKPNAPSAKAKYGTIAYTYSDSANGIYTDQVPTNAGTWYVKAIVKSTDNYAGLESDAVSFIIAPKDITSNSQIIIPDITADMILDEIVIKDGEKVLVQGKDYDLTKTQDGNKGIVTITCKGNYTGKITKTFTVDDKTPSSGNQNTSDKITPQTGDNNKTGLFTTMSLLSAGLIAFLTGKKRKDCKK